MGEGVDPTQMCQSLVDKVARSRQLAALADPEMLILFEEWLEQLEDEIASRVKETPGLKAPALAHKLGVPASGVAFLLDRLKKQGVVFAGNLVGAPGGQLRQIFSAPEMVDGQPFSVLELAERHRGYQGFLPPQADSLMKSTAPR